MIMDEKEKLELAKLHQKILDDLEYIKIQTTKTNGRVTKIEEVLAVHDADIAKAMIQISRNSGAIAGYKQEADEAKDELIQRYEKEISNYKERRFWVLVVIVLVILGTIGIVDSELIKSLI